MYFLFNPALVKHILKYYPGIKAIIGDPENEGIKSQSFSEYRKSEKQIYRYLSVLDIPQYRKNLLSIINRNLSIGFKIPELFNTRDGDKFNSALSVLHLGNYLRFCGFNIKNPELNRKNNRVPDILIKDHNYSAAVEVYSPRDWKGYWNFMEELEDAMHNLDVPYYFECQITSDLINKINDEGYLRYFDPWEFSGFVKLQKSREKIINPLLRDLETTMSKRENEDFKKQIIIGEANLTIYFEFARVENCESNVRTRRINFQYPPLTGYAPEGMFRNLVKKRIEKKIEEKKTAWNNCGDYKILFIDISNLGYNEREFTNEYYGRKFAESLYTRIGERNITEVDVIIFGMIMNRKTSKYIFPLFFKRVEVPSDFIMKLIGNISKYGEEGRNIFKLKAL